MPENADVPDSVKLSELTTLRVGGPAKAVVVAETDSALAETVTDCFDANDPYLLVGGGSNLVVADEGVDATVVRIANSWIRYAKDHHHGDYVMAGAGTVWDELVADTVAHGFGGLECLSGIPGLAGATPVQNVGAYGVETAAVLREAEIIDPLDPVTRWIAADELEFGYRTSRIKRNDREVVVAVAFWLTSDGLSAPIRYRELAATLGVAEGDRAPVASVRDAVLELRARKGMVLDPADHDTWSVGSFFTNPIVPDGTLPGVIERIAAHTGVEASQVPVYPADGGLKLSAGWLIERAGYARGYPDANAPARISTKHTLALTNRGSATTRDIIALAAEVADGVDAAFGVRLVPEPKLVGCAI